MLQLPLPLIWSVCGETGDKKEEKKETKYFFKEGNWLSQHFYLWHGFSENKKASGCWFPCSRNPLILSSQGSNKNAASVSSQLSLPRWEACEAYQWVRHTAKPPIITLLKNPHISEWVEGKEFVWSLFFP